MSNMDKKAPATVQGESFLDFMRAREQWVSLAVLAALFAVVGVVFHAAYPVPFIFHDSYTYVNAAITGIFDIYRPNGYPRWLRSSTASRPRWVSSIGFILCFMHLRRCSCSSRPSSSSASVVRGFSGSWRSALSSRPGWCSAPTT